MATKNHDSDAMAPAMPAPVRASRGQSVRRLGLIAAVFLTIWSARLVIIGRYGTDIPYWDQWGKEGELFYIPWFEHHEFWSRIFVPHNEHRIAPTLALNLALVRLGGDQWDARVQCVVNAALWAALMAALAAWALRQFPPRRATGIAITIALLGAPPIAWENVVGGFQSQFYFLALFSLLALAGLLGAGPRSWRWYGGLIAAALAQVSMGSGMLVALPVALIAALRFLEANRREASPLDDPRGKQPDQAAAVATFGAALVIGGAGWWFRPQAPWHTVIHAHSLVEGAVYLLRCMAWPRYETPALAVVFWAPWLVLAVRRVLGRSPTGQSARANPSEISQRTRSTTDLILAGGLWVLAQFVAVSYSRAGASVLPAPRYGDFCALGLVFNALALARLARPSVSSHQPATPGAKGTPQRTLAGAALLWFAVVATTIGLATRATLSDPLPNKQADAIGYERNVHAFVLTDDYPALAKASPIPFPMADWFARLLRNPTLHRLLPQSIRAPLAVAGLDDGQPGVAGLPPLDHRHTRTLIAPSEWQSAPLPPDHGWWKIETAGDIGAPGATLELVAVSDHRVLARIAPSKPAGRAWRAAYVRAPREPAFFHARVTAPAHVLGFSDPIEMSTLSFWTWRLTQQAFWLELSAGIALLAFSLAVASARPDEIQIQTRW